jgi:PAS domain S-box-containing protein
MFTGHEKYKQILEAMPDGLFIVDKQLVVHYMNPAIISMIRNLNLTIDLIGRKFTDVFPSTVPYMQSEINEVYKTGKPIRVEHTIDVGTATVSYETVRIPMLDTSGNITAVLNSIHNITNFLKIQKELQESRHLFETMVDNANSIILRMDLDGRITYLNKFAEHFFGYKREEMFGRTVQETIIPDIDSEGIVLKNLIARIVENSSLFAANENENIKKDGTRVWISWSNKPVLDTNGIVREILCVGNDITALKNAQLELVAYRDHLEELVRKRTEELTRSERLASLGTLVSGVAHEINNPNNFITLNADNLQEIWKEIVPILDKKVTDEPEFKLVGIPYTVLREEMEHLISGIRSGSRRIRTIVTHLKEFARQGPIDMNQEIDCAKVLEAAQVIVANTIKKSTNKFITHIATPLPLVKGDFQKLEQVIINLLTNACQALTSREQSISVTIRPDNQSQIVEIIVEDQGRGIDAEYLPHIFDPFFTTKRDAGGTGLGLSISYGIIKDHQGTMTVASVPAKGSTFTITLPANRKQL